MIVLPCFIIGGIGICLFNGLLIIPWISAFLLYFGLIEIRVMCSHCPHYAEQTKTLKCWANYGSPKIWKYRPYSMSPMEKSVFYSGLLIFIYPSVIMIIPGEYILLSLYVLSILIGGYFMVRFMCKKCMNFMCPLNRVPRETREKFSEHNSPQK